MMKLSKVNPFRRPADSDAPSLPRTEADDQEKGFRPGSPEYEAELDNLLSRRITYEQFMERVAGEQPDPK